MRNELEERKRSANGQTVKKKCSSTLLWMNNILIVKKVRLVRVSLPNVRFSLSCCHWNTSGTRADDDEWWWVDQSGWRQARVLEGKGRRSRGG